MKRLTLGLMMALLVSACNESTTGIKSGGRSDNNPFVPPDSIIEKNGITAEVFGPEHPVAMARETSLAAREDVSSDFTALEALGYSYTPGSAMVYNLRLSDGRVAELTILHLAGDGGGFSHLVHLRIGNRELVRSIRVLDRGDGRVVVEPLADPAKLGGRPQAIWTFGWSTCVVQAYVGLVGCIFDCAPTFSFPCIRACIDSAVTALGNCLMFTSE